VSYSFKSFGEFIGGVLRSGGLAVATLVISVASLAGVAVFVVIPGAFTKSEATAMESRIAGSIHSVDNKVSEVKVAQEKAADALSSHILAPYHNGSERDLSRITEALSTLKESTSENRQDIKAIRSLLEQVMRRGEPPR